MDIKLNILLCLKTNGFWQILLFWQEGHSTHFSTPGNNVSFPFRSYSLIFKTPTQDWCICPWERPPGAGDKDGAKQPVAPAAPLFLARSVGTGREMLRLQLSLCLKCPLRLGGLWKGLSLGKIAV